MPSWVPIFLGVLTPIGFIFENIFIKTLTSEEIGFNATRVSFQAYLMANIIFGIVGIFYYSDHVFDFRLLWVGSAGSIIVTLGIVCINNAFSLGPAGPCSAIASTPPFFFVVICAIKDSRFPGPLELVALLFGTIGTFYILAPTSIAKIFYPCLYEKLHPEEARIESDKVIEEVEMKLKTQRENLLKEV
jgi:hypothetical protein